MTSVATELLVCGSAPALSGLLERGSFQVRATAGPRLLVPPPRYRTLGRVATEVVFFTFIPTILQKDRVQKNRLPSHSTMMGRKSSIFRRGWWGPLGDGLLWVEFSPIQATERPRKGAAALFPTEKGVGWLHHQAPGCFSCRDIASLLVPLGSGLRPGAKYP